MKALHRFSAILFSLFLLGSLPLAAQQTQDSESLFATEQQRSNPHFGLQFGSSFTTGFGGGNLFTQTIAPNLRWDLSQRWSLTVGTIFSSTQMSGFGAFYPMGSAFGAGQSLASPGRLFSATTYSMGVYQVNPRLIISGGAWMEHNNMPGLFQQQMNPQAFNMQGRGMMVGFDYQVSEGFSVGAQVRMSGGYNQFNQFYAPGPFHRSMQPGNPFFRPAGW
jgi:hypothetical protein